MKNLLRYTGHMRAGVLVLGAILGGCAQSGSSQQTRKPLAPYAVATGGMAWSVTCPGGTVASDFSDNEAFYDENGKLKEWEQFCADMTAGSRIRGAR